MTGDQRPLDPTSKLTRRIDIDFALQALGVGVWELDPLTQQLGWDDRCCELYGLTGEYQLPYEQTLQYIHSDDVNRVKVALQRAISLQSGGSYDETYRTIGADDGKLRWVRFQGRAYFTSMGEVDRFSGIARDVTEQVLDRRQLAESERQLQTMIEQAPVAIALFSGQDMIFQVCNEGMLNIIGKDKSVIGRPLAEAVPELEGQGFVELQQQVYRTGEPVFGRAVPATIAHNGNLEKAYYDFTYSPLRTPSGTVSGVMVVAIDVTQQVMSRQVIEASEQLLRNMVLLAPIGISILNAADLVIETVNDAFMEVAGKTYDQLIGQHYWVPFAEAAPYYADALSRVAQEGEPFSISEVELMLIRHGKEELIHVTFVYMPIKDGAGKVRKVVVWVLENTHQVAERRRIEEQVQQRTQELAAVNEELAAANEELAATNEELATNNEQYAALNEELEETNTLLNTSNDNLQRFAYVASHDLQEPLRKIQQFGDLLKTRYGHSTGEELMYLERMQSAAHRMATLIKDLLDYSRVTSRPETEVSVPLYGVVKSVLTTLELVIAETNATVHVSPLPTIVGDASQLDQLFQNLLSNALKFRQQHIAPIIRIEAQTIQSAQLPPGVKPLRTASHYNQIDVRDNGVGFDEKYLDRIFQVFQRLYGRNEYAGTGIGLAICEKVVANHGGAITAKSRPNEGATFTIYLPA